VNPEISQASLIAKSELRDHVRYMCRHFLVPLQNDVDVSYARFRKHLHDVGYTNSRILQYDAARQRYEECGSAMPFRRLKGRMKREKYRNFKHHRGLNVRGDEFKSFLGPISSVIEQAVYDIEVMPGVKCFIKHVPVCDRPRYLHAQTLNGACVLETDHTAFEAHMTPDIIDLCEMQLYSYMLKNLPERDEVLGTIKATLTGLNRISYRGFDVYVHGRRMSGDMVTSVGNGWTNLCLATYLLHKKGYNPGSYFITVEGDDGLAQIVLNPDGTGVPSDQDFTQCGFEVKMQVRPSMSESSFCGLVSHPEVGDNLIDPMEAVADFGWSSSTTRNDPRKHLALLRGKALSLLCEAPGCPVVRSLADYGIRVTMGADVRYDDTQLWWIRQLQIDRTLGRSLRTTVDWRSRMVVEREFGLSIGAQLRIESYLGSLNALCPLNCPDILSHCEPDWFRMWDLGVHD